MLVSHDRYLIDHLAGQIWAIEGDGLFAYPSTYQEYVVLLAGQTTTPEEESEAEGNVSTPTQEAPPPLVEEAGPPGKGWSRGARRSSERRRRQLEGELEDVEFQVARAGEALETARASGDPEAIALWEGEYVQARRQLDELLAEWALLA
jgi:ATP-binding cassette subfamily F protein 3